MMMVGNDDNNGEEHNIQLRRRLRCSNRLEPNFFGFFSPFYHLLTAPPPESSSLSEGDDNNNIDDDYNDSRTATTSTNEQQQEDGEETTVQQQLLLLPGALFDNDIFSIILEFVNVLDLDRWKSVSKGFKDLCTSAIENKCHNNNNRKAFKYNKDLRETVRKYYIIKYDPTRYYGGNEKRRRKGAEEIASTYGWNIDKWDVSQVKIFRGIFSGYRKFNEFIGSWDTSNATNMENMFCNAESFNRDISSWDTSKVRLMSRMFHNAKSFNQPTIGRRWDVSRVISFWRMFANADSFNARQLPWFRDEMLR